MFDEDVVELAGALKSLTQFVRWGFERGDRWLSDEDEREFNRIEAVADDLIERYAPEPASEK